MSEADEIRRMATDAFWLTIRNDREAINHWRSRGESLSLSDMPRDILPAVIELADEMRGHYEKHSPFEVKKVAEIASATSFGPGDSWLVYTDLMTHALALVLWIEIAAHIILVPEGE